MHRGGKLIIPDKKINELTTQDNQKFSFKISLSSQIADIKSKFYDYKGFRRYQFVLAETDEQEKIASSIKNYQETKYTKIEGDIADTKDIVFFIDVFNWKVSIDTSVNIVIVFIENWSKNKRDTRCHLNCF